MKKNLPVTDREKVYSSDLRIVSTTDTKGVITYSNGTFQDISGFTDTELLGKSHNIVRHPDMPQAAFQDLWSTLKQGKSWMGVVKNRCKNGDYYWVDAFISPIKSGEEVVGYQSVRTKPSQEHVRNAESLYDTLTQGATRSSTLRRLFSLTLFHKMILGNLSILSVVALMLYGGVPQVIALLSGALVALGISQWIARPWQRAAESTRQIIDNAVARKVYTDRDDELGQLLLSIKLLQSQTETIVWRLGDAADNLKASSIVAEEVSKKTDCQMNKQMQEVEMVATAMNEMTSTVQEVATNTSNTADSTARTNDEVDSGHQVVKKVIEAIHLLAEKVDEASAVIARLAEDSEQIGSVVEVIRGIADQTNLLALNAAIEAARAGEQGRGFAVVADEVRTLASRTQSSTDEIQHMIGKLQGAAEQAVSVMAQGKRSADNSVNHATAAGESLTRITQAVSDITTMTLQIATAAEEQSAVSEEINRNIVNIRDASSDTVEATQYALNTNQALAVEIERLQTMVKQFGML